MTAFRERFSQLKNADGAWLSGSEFYAEDGTILTMHQRCPIETQPAPADWPAPAHLASYYAALVSNLEADIVSFEKVFKEGFCSSKYSRRCQDAYTRYAPEHRCTTKEGLEQRLAETKALLAEAQQLDAEIRQCWAAAPRFMGQTSVTAECPPGLRDSLAAWKERLRQRLAPKTTQAPETTTAPAAVQLSEPERSALVAFQMAQGGDQAAQAAAFAALAKAFPPPRRATA